MNGDLFLSVLYFGRRICDSVACLCSVRAVEAPHGDASDLDTADAQFNCQLLFCRAVYYVVLAAVFGKQFSLVACFPHR